MKRIALISSLVLFYAASLHAQQSAGSIVGHIHLENTDRARELTVSAQEVMSRTTFETSEVDTAGDFEIRNVPFATYNVFVLDQGKRVLTRRVVVNSVVPVTVTIDTLPAVPTEEVIVTGNQMESTQPTVHTLFTAPAIRSLPAPNPIKAVESVLLNSPGIVPDEDGRLHMRGEDAMLQYVIDGIPLTTNQTRIYAPLFDASFIESADLLRGSLNPEYGVATAGVLNVTTKSGYDAPSFGHAEYSMGTFNNNYTGVDFGGHFTQAFAFYGAYGNFSSDRYLDPVSGFDPNHTAGNGNDYFGKINILLGNNLDLTALGYYGLTKYQVPNSTDSSHQDQNGELASAMFGLRLNYQLSASSVLSLLGYTRRQEADLTSNGLDNLSSTPDSAHRATALQSERYFIGAHRKDIESGGQLEYSAKTDWFGDENQFKLGAGGEVFPLSEYFTFAVTDSNVSNPTFPGGDDRLVPYDLTKGGHPFLVDTSATGKRVSAYAQDVLTAGAWTIAGGLRFDYYDLLGSESGLSPRLNLVYRASDALILRASYNRMFMQAPLENILVSSSAAAGQLVGAEQGSAPRIVQSEKSNVFEVGAGYQLNKYLDFDLTGYGKLIDEMVVKVELGNSGIIFPANIKQGVVLGGELSVQLRNWNNISGDLAFSTISSQGKKPSDGSSPFAAGLVLGEEGENYANPWPGEDMFNTEHNQLFTTSFNLRYNHPSGFTFVLGGRFDSGLPFDLVDPTTGVGPDPTRSQQLLEQRGYSDAVINLLNLNSDQPGSPDKSVAPHATFDGSIGYDLARVGIPVKVTGSVINIFDTQYLIKFESAFGGTHFGTPRMFVLTGTLEY
jgi:outer membrane receptor protein involved in Fe transport